MASTKVASKRPKNWPKRDKGRPEIINQELIDTICNAIRMGVFVETAACFAGISKETWHAWLKKGAKEPDSIYKHFSDSILKASADAIMRKVNYVDKAAATDWRAAAWHLERLSDRFAQKAVIKHEDDNTPADKSSFSGENLHKLLCDIINEDEKE
jgi:hypothetical protein